MKRKLKTKVKLKVKTKVKLRLKAKMKLKVKAKVKPKICDYFFVFPNYISSEFDNTKRMTWIEIGFVLMISF